MNVREDDDFTPVVRELLEGALQDIAEVAGLGAGLGRGTAIDGVKRGAIGVIAGGVEGGLGTASAAAEFVAGEVGDDGEEPGLEAATLETVEAAPCANEGFLGGVLGSRWRAEHAQGECVDGVLEANDEGVECGEVASLGTFNQGVESAAV